MRELKAGPMDAAEMVAARKALGLSQVEFGRRLDLSLATISTLERGTPIRLTIAYAIRFLLILEDMTKEKAK